MTKEKLFLDAHPHTIKELAVAQAQKHGAMLTARPRNLIYTTLTDAIYCLIFDAGSLRK